MLIGNEGEVDPACHEGGCIDAVGYHVGHTADIKHNVVAILVRIQRMVDVAGIYVVPGDIAIPAVSRHDAQSCAIGLIPLDRQTLALQ